MESENSLEIPMGNSHAIEARLRLGAVGVDQGPPSPEELFSGIPWNFMDFSVDFMGFLNGKLNGWTSWIMFQWINYPINFSGSWIFMEN